MIQANTWFWRTIQSQEIDYVGEIDGIFSAYEIKWSRKKTTKPSRSFMENNGVDKIKLINPHNNDELLI